VNNLNLNLTQLYNMERDPQISKLIREGGVVHAPDGFTGKVMDMIAAQPEKKKYKPLIGRSGRIMIILFVIAVIVLSLVYAEPGGRIMENARILSKLNWQMPQIDWDFSFLSGIKLPTGIVAALLAIFILVLSDAGLNRRRFVF
jgi:hypothetical protein